MTFYQWLCQPQQQKRNDPIGDIARDVSRDEDWPKRFRATTDPRRVYVACGRYLRSLHVSGDCMQALKRCIVEYRATAWPGSSATKGGLAS